MAFDITTNPWTIAAADVAAAQIIWRGNVHILNIEMQGYAADTDVCTVLNLAGKVIWQGNGASDLETVRSGHIGNIIDGVKFGAGGITAGFVRIYIK